MTSRTANSGGQGSSHQSQHEISGAPPSRSPHSGGAAAPFISVPPILRTPPHPSQRAHSHRSLSSQSVSFSPNLTSSSSSSSGRSRSIPRRLLAPVLNSVGASSRSHSASHGGASASSAAASSSSSARMDHPASPSAFSASLAVSARRSRSRSRDMDTGSPSSGVMASPPVSPRPNVAARPAASASAFASGTGSASPRTPRGSSSRRLRSPLSSSKKSAATASASTTSDRDAALRARARTARLTNDSMVYLDGPCVYACSSCRTHLTSHDDIISKSFHGRHGRAYLFDQCVNVNVGEPEDRLLITGMHSVCDIKCKRCDTTVGWTYKRAYESSQKYKEGKFIVEKIHLHLEEGTAGCYDGVGLPAGERGDRWRKRSISWGSAADRDRGRGRGASFDESGSFMHSPGSRAGNSSGESMVYEYRPDGGDVAGRLGVSPNQYRQTQSLVTDRLSGAGAAGGGRTLPPGPPNL